MSATYSPPEVIRPLPPLPPRAWWQKISAQAQVSPEAIRTLRAMGFERAAARRALTRTGNDIPAAIMILKKGESGSGSSMAPGSTFGGPFRSNSRDDSLGGFRSGDTSAYYAHSPSLSSTTSRSTATPTPLPLDMLDDAHALPTRFTSPGASSSASSPRRRWFAALGPLNIAAVRPRIPGPRSASASAAHPIPTVTQSAIAGPGPRTTSRLWRAHQEQLDDSSPPTSTAEEVARRKKIARYSVPSAAFTSWPQDPSSFHTHSLSLGADPSPTYAHSISHHGGRRSSYQSVNETHDPDHLESLEITSSLAHSPIEQQEEPQTPWHSSHPFRLPEHPLCSPISITPDTPQFDSVSFSESDSDTTSTPSPSLLNCDALSETLSIPDTFGVKGGSEWHWNSDEDENGSTGPNRVDLDQVEHHQDNIKTGSFVALPDVVDADSDVAAWRASLSRFGIW